MQKNSGGGEDLIRGGDIFYLGGCTPPCTPPENPPMVIVAPTLDVVNVKVAPNSSPEAKLDE